MTEEQTVDKIQECQQQLSMWDFENTCYHVLQHYSDYPAPHWFLVLPADLGSWNDSDPTTHNFRLYFICDLHQR